MSYFDDVTIGVSLLEMEIQTEKPLPDSLPGVSTGSEFTTDSIVTGVLWRGSYAQRLVSEQYRKRVSAMAVIDPDKYPPDEIPRDGRMLIGKELFSIIYIDDVLNQGDLIQIPLEYIQMPDVSGRVILEELTNIDQIANEGAEAFLLSLLNIGWRKLKTTLPLFMDFYRILFPTLWMMEQTKGLIRIQATHRRRKRLRLQAGGH